MTLRKRIYAAVAVMTGATLGLWFLPLDAQRLTLFQRIELSAHARLMKARDSAPLLPFTTDGCSGGMSTVWRGLAEISPDVAETIGAHPPWEACCVTHDRAYHNAGAATNAKASFDARKQADTALRDCVAAWDTSLSPGGQQALAEAMYHAVRVGGGPCTGLAWRWGYGLPGCTGLLDQD